MKKSDFSTSRAFQPHQNSGALPQASFYPAPMPKTPRNLRKLSPFFLFPFTLFLIFLLSLPWVSAQEPPKPQPWQIDGIVAALDDGHDRVKGYAFEQLAKYKWQDLKAMVKKPEDLTKKAVALLKDEEVDTDARGSAAKALSKLGQTAELYIPDILNFLQDEKVEKDVRRDTADALKNFGQTAEPYIPKIINFLQDEKVSAYVRGGAAIALGKLGQATESYIPQILNFIKDEKVEASVRGSAAVGLGSLKSAAESYIPEIANIFKDEKVDIYVRSGAAVGLGILGQAAESYIPEFLNFIKDEKVDTDARSYVTRGLGDFKEAAEDYIPEIANILRSENVNINVRGSAAVALGNLGEATKLYIPDILKALKDTKVSADIRSNMAKALGNLEQATEPYIPEILNFIKDQKRNTDVRGNAAKALGNLEQAVEPYIPDILNLIKDQKVNADVRGSAAVGLGNLGQVAETYIPEIANILKDEKVNANVRYGAAVGLSNLGQAVEPYIPELLNFLKDEQVNVNVRRNLVVALGKFRKLELNEVVTVLNTIHEPNQRDFEQMRFFTYFLGGGTDEVKTLLTWLGYPQKTPPQLNYEDGKKTLEVFLQVWEPCQELKRLRKDLAEQIAIVAANKKVPWRWQDIGLLKRHYNNLKTVYPTKATVVQSAINKLEFWQWLLKARNTILIHITFWLALIFAYPKFPQVQAIFFWNPWVRKILGVGYVGFLLTWIPYLRRKLFEPFKPSLQADARLDTFGNLAYFPQSQVKVPGSGETKPITTALPSIQGQIVLEGDSGWGKSMFLRHLVANSRQIIVYLPAQKCNQGVIEAIQAKLHGQAQDAAFLKNLIYSGAIDICIDGLNELLLIPVPKSPTLSSAISGVISL